MDVATTIRERGGFASRSQLLAAGCPPRAIAAARAAGTIERVRRSWYTVPGTPQDARRAVAFGGRLGGLSAARSYGIWTGGNRDLHVSWPAHGNVAKMGKRMGFPLVTELHGARVVSHWKVLRGLETPEEPWRESVEQALAQVLLTSDRGISLAVLDSALHIGALAHHQLHYLFARMPARVRALRELIDDRADSGLESITRLWLSDAGVDFEVHPTLAGLEVDFLIGDSLVLELDGSEFHSGPAAFERDRQRDLVLSSLGYIVVRFSYQQVMTDWDACANRLLAHLAHGDHRRAIRTT